MRYITAPLLCLFISVGCGLSTTDATDGDCQEGFERNEEGNCSSASSDDLDPDDRVDGDVDADGAPDEGPTDNDCEDNEECTLDKCPPESVRCVCLAEEGICVPGCQTDDDCPEIDDDVLVCDEEGICGPEII